MKKENVIKVAAAIGAITLMTGGMIAADAAVSKSFGDNNFSGTNIEGRSRGFMQGLSEEERSDKMAEMTARREAILSALKSEDYEAWKLAVGDNHPFADKITSDNFAEFAAAHQDMNTLSEKLSAMGLEREAHVGMGRKIGHRQGQGRGCNLIQELPTNIQ